MTNAIALPTTLPATDWLDLPPAQLRELHRLLVRESAARLNVIAELEQALAACRLIPDAATAADALRAATLLAVRGHAA